MTGLGRSVSSALIYRSHLHLLHYCGDCPSPRPAWGCMPPEWERGWPGFIASLLPFLQRGRLCPDWAYFLTFIMKG